MKNDLCIEAVGKRFGAVQALNDVSLNIRPGELFGLIGPDGAGKTTLLRLLTGLLSLDEGGITVAGHALPQELGVVRSLVGYMPQRFSLYPDLSVVENLLFFARLFRVPSDQRHTRMQRLLRFSKLEPFTRRRAQALSGGMKQKLALSCILMHTPQVLLLDEPTTGVDPVSRREFWKILRELRNDGVTLLVTTPYMDEAEQCDRIAFLHQGTIIVEGDPRRLPDSYPAPLVEIRCTDVVRAAQILQDSGAAESVQIFGDRLHVVMTSEAHTSEPLREILRKRGIAVETIRQVDAAIEDLFVHLIRSHP
ncbi:ABC transporter ATP-binding protein [candidate division KSB1 bacterium]|nr:ABC transporter ATP-binding protein [candidate division KSB1 bacterium]